MEAFVFFDTGRALDFTYLSVSAYAFITVLIVSKE